MDPNSYDYPHPSSYSYPPDDGTTPLTPYNFGGIPTVPPPPLPPRRPQVLVRIAIVGALIILLGATIGAFALTRQPSSQSKMSASTSPQPGGSPSMTVTTSTQTVLSTATVSSAITATSDAATATPFPTATTIPPLTATLLYNNIGISSDDDPAMGNFNGVGDSYSAQALAQAGISPGQPVAYDQMSFIWPQVAPGLPDNMLLQGQDIQITASQGYARLGFLGSAVVSPQTAAITIVYTDGSTQTATLGLSDWFLAFGTKYGNALIATLPYYNSAKGKATKINYLFYAEVALQSNKIVKQIDFSTDTLMHLFAIAAA